ncbi:MAG: YbjQ family protein [Candidatus Diapherotrites archaeon]|nr:YbjQ family protein [Candidatus Diapherotrites archaeon]
MTVKKEVHIVSTESVPGFESVEAKGFVWATSVNALGVADDLQIFSKNLTGGRVEHVEGMLNGARSDIMKKLAANSRKIGGDAVVSTRLSVAQYTRGVVEILAYGTAVKLRKKRK